MRLLRGAFTLGLAGLGRDFFCLAGQCIAYNLMPKKPTLNLEIIRNSYGMAIA